MRGLRLRELGGLRRFHAGDLDDVVAEFRCDRADELAHLRAERGILERLHHHAAAEETEVTALCG